MRTKLVPVAAAALMSIVALTGCGGGDDSSSAGGYCDKVKDAMKDSNDDLSDADSEKLFRDLGDSAPGELKDAFKTVLDGADQASADVPDAADMEDMTPEEVQKQLEELQDSAGDLDKVTDALKKIQTYTEKECDVDLTE